MAFGNKATVHKQKQANEKLDTQLGVQREILAVLERIADTLNKIEQRLPAD